MSLLREDRQKVAGCRSVSTITLACTAGSTDVLPYTLRLLLWIYIQPAQFCLHMLRLTCFCVIEKNPKTFNINIWEKNKLLNSGLRNRKWVVILREQMLHLRSRNIIAVDTYCLCSYAYFWTIDFKKLVLFLSMHVPCQCLLAALNISICA